MSASTGNLCIHSIYGAIVDGGQRTVHLAWCPSHCGISGNEEADRLANQGAQKGTIVCYLPRPIAQLKVIVRNREAENYNATIAARAQEIPSLRRYLDLTDGRPPDYVALGFHTRHLQTSYSRLRIGYRYLWEVIHRPDGDARDRDTTCDIIITTRTGKTISTECRLCGESNKHTYRHYIMDCVKLQNYRKTGICSMFYMVQHLADPLVFKRIKAAYPRFLQAR